MPPGSSNLVGWDLVFFVAVFLFIFWRGDCEGYFKVGLGLCLGLGLGLGLGFIAVIFCFVLCFFSFFFLHSHNPRI